MTTAVIFGAGPGLGLANARKLGRRGAKVALVARNLDRLRDFTATLADEGFAASAYAGDITDPQSCDDLVSAIASSMGPIDLAVYQTAGPAPTVRSSLDVTIDNERIYVERLLMAPLHFAHRVLAAMLERGTGSLVFTIGSSALVPTPPMSQVGPPQAALRNHVLNLSTEATPRGVQVGVLTIGGLILGSDLQRAWFPAAGPSFPGALDPDVLADAVSELMTLGSGPERAVPPPAAPGGGG